MLEQTEITDEEALLIKEVTEEKIRDSDIHATVQAHRYDQAYLEETYHGQVNGKIQTAYDDRGRYEELGDPKYTDAGAIFDIMALTVVQHHLGSGRRGGPPHTATHSRKVRGACAPGLCYTRPTATKRRHAASTLVTPARTGSCIPTRSTSP